MPSTIFRGTKVKTLKDTLTLNDKADIIASTTDPTSVAVDAPVGSLLLNQTNGKLYRKLDSGSSTNWSLVGSGTGNVNFVSNGDSEAGTTGVATYADAAGVAPVDGTGGSPNVTVTSSATSPLDGLRSFLFTKDAANRQGQGWSIDYSISTQYRGGIADISFYYSINSGTYADGDVRVYMYDVTNSVLIEPTPLTLLNVGVASKRVSKFQFPINSSSYRLIFHVASTSASAYELKVDSISVSPQNVAYGTTVTDWASFTPTTSTANATVTGRYRRIGDSVEIYALVKMTGAATSAVNVSLPTGLSVDTSKLPNTAEPQSIGSVYMLDSGTAHYVGSAVWESAATAITLFGNNVANRVNNGPNPFTIANGDVFSLVAALPISGWSSNTVVSDQADTRVVTAKATSATTNIGTTATDVINPTVVYDTHGAYNSSTGEYTVPFAGKYRVSVLNTRSTVSGTVNNGILLFVYKNGSSSQVVATTIYQSTASIAQSLVGSTEIDCVAGDKLKIVGSRDTNAGSAALDGSSLSNFVIFTRVSGPAQIAASEKVEAIYSTPATTSMTSGTEYFNSWTVKIRDTHNAVQGSSSALVTSSGTGWRFIAPRSGMYKWMGISNLNSATGFNGTSETFFGYAYVNGVDVFKSHDVVPGSGQGFPTLPIFGAAYLSVGDRLEFSVAQLSGGSLAQQASANARIAIWSD